MKWTNKQQHIIRAIDEAYEFLDMDDSDSIGDIQMYIEAHIGPLPEGVSGFDWSEDLYVACEILKDLLSEMDDEELEFIINDREESEYLIRTCFGYDSYVAKFGPLAEYEVKATELLIKEVHVAFLRGAASANEYAEIHARIEEDNISLSELERIQKLREIIAANRILVKGEEA